ncbi:hypothetical protein CBM2637_A60178 [Cupriavidus taiwanensis]|nr:hypothetical protein CBM2637_A60178 [Cupriavidus taiwanensis]
MRAAGDHWRGKDWAAWSVPAVGACARRGLGAGAGQRQRAATGVAELAALGRGDDAVARRRRRARCHRDVVARGQAGGHRHAERPEVGGIGAVVDQEALLRARDLQHEGLDRRAVGAHDVTAVVGNGDGGKNGDDRHGDHHFDQREAMRRPAPASHAGSPLSPDRPDSCVGSDPRDDPEYDPKRQVDPPTVSHCRASMSHARAPLLIMFRTTEFRRLWRGV